LSEEKEHKSGYVAVLGEPNTGKSSFINYVLNEKVSIVSHRPQTTRRSIFGIFNSPDAQLIFLDTPGIFAEERHYLDIMLRLNVKQAIADADALVVMIADKKIAEVTRYLLEQSIRSKKGFIVALNKSDKIDYDGRIYDALANMGVDNSKIVQISVKEQKNLDKLFNAILKMLPEGPNFYEDDIYTTQSMRNIVSETIREQVLLSYFNEVPHCTAVMTDEFKDKGNIVYIHSTIFVEKESQKKIIIGQNGSKIKKISTQARKEIEKLLDKKVFLELYVKLSKNWRKNPRFIKEYLDGPD